MSNEEYHWCEKRFQRIKVTFCIFRKCHYLREIFFGFECKFKPKNQRIVERNKS